MRIEQLEFFVTTADYHSMQKAADLLHTSIQNISKSIKALEQQFNTRFFDRTKQGIFLTVDGEFMYKEAKEILKHYSNLNEEFGNIKHVELDHADFLFNILSCLSIRESITNSIEHLYKSNSNIRFSHITDESYNINSMFYNNTPALKDYHIIISAMGQNELTTLQKLLKNKYQIIALKEEYIGIHVSPKSKLAVYDEVPLKALLREPLISFSSYTNKSQFLSIIEEYGVKLKPAIQVNSSEQCTEYISNNAGYGFVALSKKRPSNFQNKNIISLPLKEKLKIIYLLFLPYSELNNPYVKEFSKQLLQNFENAQKILS